MTVPVESTCMHCGIRFRWKPIELLPEQGDKVCFCCRGCQGAYQLIQEAGLGQFYQRADRSAPTVEKTLNSSFSEEDLARHLVPEGEFCRLDVMIGGISCPSCVWLLERMIRGVSGVEHVSISYSGGIASLRLDPHAVKPAGIFEMIARLGYTPRPYSPDQSEKDARLERDDLLLRFGTALFLTMQLMAYSYALYAGYFQGMDAKMKYFLQYVSLAVTTPVVFYSGYPFLKGALRSLRTRAPGMDLLIATGSLSAWFYSLWATVAGRETYFDSAAMIVTFVLVGRLLELSVRRRAMSGVGALYATAPQHATIVEDGGAHRRVEANDVRPGDLLLVRQGERFPVDCLVAEGETEIDQSLATGESLPVLVRVGEEIRSGCVNVSAPVTVQALRPAGQSYLMRVAALVQMAQSGKPRLQLLADRVSGWFVPAVILLALLSGMIRFFVAGDPAGTALMSSLAIILIACPCAMGLAVPAAVLAACSRAAARGIIIRGGDVIERMATIDTALFDKTGTITLGEPAVIGLEVFAGHEETDIMAAVATVEEPSHHPLARSLIAHAADAGFRPAPCRRFRAVPGRGISGLLPDGRNVLCGSALFMAEQGIETGGVPVAVNSGATAVLVAIEGVLAGRYLLSDQLRPGTRDLLSDLTSHGMDLCVISGDNQETLDRISAELGGIAAIGSMTPDQKLAHVKSVQSHKRGVLMAGDGVNDAPALAAATVSCSLAGSSDIALENADIIITGSDINAIGTAFHLSRATIRIIKQNLGWAFLYNLTGIPLAMSGMLTPVYAAVAMTASSLLVSLNSMRLMRFTRHG